MYLEHASNNNDPPYPAVTTAAQIYPDDHHLQSRYWAAAFSHRQGGRGLLNIVLEIQQLIFLTLPQLKSVNSVV